MPDETKLTGYPSIDRPWLKYYTEKDLALKVPQCTVYQYIYDRNKDYPNNVAILYYGNKIQYKTLFSNVEICTRALRQIGIQRGECVTLCSAGVPEAVYLVLACSRIGAIANFINPMFTKDQMLERINETEATWFFVLDAMYSYVKDVLPKTCVKNIVIISATNSIPSLQSKLLDIRSEARRIIKHEQKTQEFMLWKDFCDFHTRFNASPDVPYQPDTPMIMVYSSGSTGASKGILLTNDGINATISNYFNSGFHFEKNDSFLQIVPIWFSTGIVMSLLMPLAQGITVIPEPKFSKENFVADLIKYKPSLTLNATNAWLYAITAEEMKNADLSNMKYPITGGEKVLPKDEERVNAFFKAHGCNRKLYKGYGMCEFGSTISGTTDAPLLADKPGGCGYPILNLIIASFDVNTGKELKYGQHGELRAQSPARMKGYYKNDEATAAFFKTDENGEVWGCTGDIGYIDEDGEVFVVGRATDHCRRENGEIVFLFEIEREILKDRDVAQCKVVDMEIAEGKRLAAHIIPHPGLKNETEMIIRIHKQLVDTLPNYMVPDYYKIRSSIPLNKNGKADIIALREDREDLTQSCTFE